MKNKTILFSPQKRKRPFILLEVLIALALISLFAIPLVRAPLETIHEETKTLCKLELERNANIAFADVKELFYTQALPWDSFLGEKPLIRPLGTQTIGTRTFEKTARIRVSKEKVIRGGQTMRKLGVTLTFASPGLKQDFGYIMVVAR